MTNKVYVIDRLNLEPLGSEGSLKVLASGITKFPHSKTPRLNPRFAETTPSQNGVYEFDFVADHDDSREDDEEHIPTGDVLFYFKDLPGDMKKIVVYAETNQKEVDLDS